jgi:hypothetical protein
MESHSVPAGFTGVEDSRYAFGADSPRWTDQGHFKIIGASAPRRSQHMAVSSSACLLFSNGTSERSRTNQNRLHPVMVWRWRVDGSIGFF